jgi:NMD protein affecting ribosome stability and mRNA decay
MRKPMPFRVPHRHHGVNEHFLRQFEGVPYEVERVVCKECGRVLEERPLRRTAA